MSGTRDYLAGRWRYLLNRFVRRIWFRATLYSVAAVLVAILSGFVAPYLPFPIQLELASGSVDKILSILSSSMLAVTTFSLSIMVSAYAAAAGNSTPRATSLLINDSVASNTLATFVGSFLFAVVGIIGLAAGLYGDDGRIILFIATLVVLFFVTASLLRWIEQLTKFGRVGDTIGRVETVAAAAARSWAKYPRLGAEEAIEIPEECAPLYVEDVGYIQHVDMEALNDLAKSAGGAIHLQKVPGQFVGPDRPVAMMVTEPDGEKRRKMSECFTIGPDRSFDQDPRFGLIVLSEIASRALSPAVNDPGTAIQVLTAGVRVIEAFSEGHSEREEAKYEHVYARDIDCAEMLEDFINPIARDGASLLEVQLRLQRSLEMVALAERDLFGQAANRLSALALKRSLAGLDSSLEQSRLKRRAAWALPDKLTGERPEGAA
ncbi:MAG: DUF2254 domain-containing protein [Pacificimonas sp.]